MTSATSSELAKTESKHEYDGLAYRQSPLADAPWIVAFVASAEDLLTWAGIPRRSTGDEMMGFQRVYDPARLEKARGFFMYPENQSPTALIVGIHPVPSDVGTAGERAVEVKFDESSSGNPASLPYRRCKLTVRFDETELTTAQIVELVRRQVDTRLALAQAGSAESGTITIDADADTGAGEDANDELSADDQLDDSDDEIELGRSLLHRLRSQLDNSEWTDANREVLLDLAKPATIIDGQHRVLGAALCENRIPFSVCAMIDCTWAEQVFQFTVVNYTANGIPDQFITANAALSLTKPELNELQPRLEQAGVKVVEYELMRVVNWNADSPFYELVDLAERRNPTKIGYKTMVRLAKAWYGAQHPAFRPLLASLYPDLKGARAQAERLGRWKDGDWGPFFLDFWKQVRAYYEDKSSHAPSHKLWDVGSSNLMIAVVLLELQANFLLNLGAQDEEFFETTGEDPKEELRRKLRRRADKFVVWIPPGFFGRKWGMTSLSTGVGRRALQDTFRRLVDNKGTYQYAQSALVTGKTD